MCRPSTKVLSVFENPQKSTFSKSICPKTVTLSFIPVSGASYHGRGGRRLIYHIVGGRCHCCGLHLWGGYLVPQVAANRQLRLWRHRERIWLFAQNVPCVRAGPEF